jgi:hypothetical protein
MRSDLGDGSEVASPLTESRTMTALDNTNGARDMAADAVMHS